MNLDLPSPQTTLVIILGASDWPQDADRFPASKAFESAAGEVREYFRDFFGTSENNLLWLFDTDLNAIRIIDEICAHLKRFKGSAKDVIFYYIGHAEPTRKYDGIYLPIRGTQEYNPEGTSVKVEDLTQSIKMMARGMRRYYVFDCCFAADAIQSLQGVSELTLFQRYAEQMRKEGYAALFSSGRREPSLILPDDSSTYFTKALMRVLKQGAEEPLSFRDIYEQIGNRLEELYQKYLITHREKAMPPPVAQIYAGKIADIPLFPGKPRRSLEKRVLEKVEEALQEIAEAPKRKVSRRSIIIGGSGIVALGVSIWGSFQVFASFQQPESPLSQTRNLKTQELVKGLIGETSFSGGYVSSLSWSNIAEDVAYSLTSNKFGVVFASNLSEKLFSRDLGYSCTSVAFSPDGQFLAVGGFISNIFLYDYRRRQNRMIPAEQDTIYALSWSHDGRYLAMAGEKIILWDMKIGKKHSEYAEHKDIIRSIDFSPDNLSFASASADETVRIWRIGNPKSIYILNHRDDKRDFVRSVYAVAYSPDGSLIGTASEDGFVRIWDAKHPALATFAPGHTGPARALAWIPGKRLLVSGGDDGFVHIWDEKGDGYGNYPRREQAVSAIAFAQHSKFLAIADRSGKLSLFDSDRALLWPDV